CPVFIGVVDARYEKIYKAIEIDGSIWIVENMNYEIEETSMCYDRESENCKIYGRLYTWDAAQVACPEGYRLSKDSDWEKLETLAGGSASAANKLKSNGTDEYAFSVMFGGYANKNAISTLLGEGAYFWTELETDGRAIARSIFSSDEGVERFSSDKKIFMSVRCVKEN
ncbi:MAG TPA: FISUMP domain-containing protein, partial [Fibrobacteraceae bacterium]|nr:FISUMP domain-containing protein [Fibrobacteraceae bacterium]